MTDTKADANPFGKLNYLVIDDFENFRLSIRQMLRSCGADSIELVSNASQAIQHCTYNHVDVVLCDFNLGEGKNGQHILEDLRYKKLLKRSSLFLMVTAETSKEMVMGAREYQPDAYLTKPINRAVLEKRLSALISQRNTLMPINREIDRENYPEAIVLCLQTLPKQPRYKTWLMKTLGELDFMVGDLAHAQKVYDDILNQRELSWARLGRCKVLLANRNFDQAVDGLKALIEKHPDYMEAYDLLVQCEAGLGAIQGAPPGRGTGGGGGGGAAGGGGGPPGEERGGGRGERAERGPTRGRKKGMGENPLRRRGGGNWHERWRRGPWSLLELKNFLPSAKVLLAKKSGGTPILFGHKYFCTAPENRARPAFNAPGSTRAG